MVETSYYYKNCNCLLSDWSLSLLITYVSMTTHASAISSTNNYFKNFIHSKETMLYKVYWSTCVLFPDASPSQVRWVWGLPKLGLLPDKHALDDTIELFVQPQPHSISTMLMYAEIGGTMADMGATDVSWFLAEVASGVLAGTIHEM